MKITFQFSILFNVLLAGGLVFVILDRPRVAKVPAPISLEAQPPASAAANPVPPAVSAAQPVKFSWSQLDSRNDYRLFIANLRAIGCPENTIEDIVGGNMDRAFAWKRAQLGLNDSGAGPWSRASEMALIGNLVGNPSALETAPLRSVGGQTQAGISRVAAGGNTEDAISQNGSGIAGTVGSSQYGQSGYPSFSPGGNRIAADSGLQPGNSSGGQDASSVNELARPASGFEPQTGAPANFNPGDSSDPGTAQSADASDAPTDPSNPLGPNDPYARSAQDIQIADLNNYYDWFASQTTANVSGQSLGIDPTSYLP
jgi:hypothetical protein